MNNPKIIMKKIKSFAIITHITEQQNLVNETLNDVPHFVLTIANQTGILFDEDLINDLLRIQLGRNAHAIHKANETIEK